MYLSNTVFSFLSNKGIFQIGNPFAAKTGIFPVAEEKKPVIQNISEQIVSNQTGTERAEQLTKDAQIYKDTYVKADEATSLEEVPTDLLKVYLGIAKLFSTAAETHEQEILDFKEQLQKWDQTIQGYQDIMDGKAALPEGHTMQSILWSYQTAQKDRAQFLQDGIAHINKYQYGEDQYSEFFSNERVDHLLKSIFGENKFAAKDPSSWLIDSSASDIYSEIDRVLSEAHGVTEEFQRGVDNIYSILKERGYGEKYKSYLKSWADPKNSYFDHTEEMNIQKLMIERLMKEPLQQP